MKLQKITDDMQSLCHEGYSQLEVVILDGKAEMKKVRGVKISPTGKILILLEKEQVQD